MKRITFLLINLTFFLLSKAQIPEAPTNLQSPNAAGLGLFGEIPVSFFTGLPEIAIPLFTAPNNYKGFTIGMSYHADGVRPDQHPGWVGTNWSMMTGGCITRVIKDHDDEFKALNTGIATGFYYNYSILNPTNWDSVSNILSIANNKDYSVTYKDSQPDEFSFYFGDYSGKFYLNELGQWTVQCNKPVKVTFDGNFVDPPNSLILSSGTSTSMMNAYLGRTKSFNSFTICTEEGTQYIFGNDTSAIEYSMPFFDQVNSTWVPNAWYLTKIVYANSKYVNFNYQRDNKVSQMYISNTQLLSQSYTMGNTSPSCYSPPANINDIYDSYGGELISPVYLTSILSPDFSIQFQRGYTYELRYNDSIYQSNINKLFGIYYPNGGSVSDRGILPYLGDLRVQSINDMLHYNLTWCNLNSIKIYDYNQKLMKEFDFHYNNGAGATGDPRLTSTQRLFLLSMDEINGSYGVKGTFSFEYDNIDKVPPYLANRTDHWGFYNNKYAYLNNPSAYYSFREPDSTVMKFGSLNKIIYPTGGSTEFVYEANQYSRQLKIDRWLGDSLIGGNRITGGLRIKKIINDPNNGQNPVLKEYFYVKDYSATNQTGTSSGVLGGQIQYLFKNYQVKNTNISCLCGPPSSPIVYGDLMVNKSIFSTQSVLPACTNSLGSHIGYSEVVEKLSDGSFTRYRYSNFDNGYLDERFDNALQLSITPYQPYNSKLQERGNLLAKEVYDATGKCQYKELNNYVKTSTPYIRSITGKTVSVCPTLSLYYYEGTANRIYTYSMLLSDKKEITFNNTDSLVNETSFSYDSNYPIMVNQIKKNSHGDTLTTVYTYPFHIAGQYNAPAPGPSSAIGSRTISTVLSSNCMNMLTYHFINSPIEILTYKNKNVIDGKFIFYGKHGANNYLPDSVYSIETSTPLSTFYRYSTPTYPQNIIDGRYEKSPSESFMYDSNSNMIQMTNKEGFNTSYLWSYNGLYPIAEIKNATYNQVSNLLGASFLNNLSAEFKPSVNDSTSVNGLRASTSLSNTQITTYTFVPLVGIQTKTAPNNIITTFVYDNFNRLYRAEDTNGKIVQEYQYYYKP